MPTAAIIDAFILSSTVCDNCVSYFERDALKGYRLYIIALLYFLKSLEMVIVTLGAGLKFDCFNEAPCYKTNRVCKLSDKD